MNSAGKPKILIGPITCDKSESVGMVNESFITGLTDKYTFVRHLATRSTGSERQGSFNLVNLLYLFKHFAIWLYCILRHRPRIAHYALTSGCNLEKSLLLLSVASLFRIKTIAHLHGGSFIEFWKALPPWRRSLAFRQLKQLSALVVLSEGWCRSVRETVGLPNLKLFVVNNPIDSTFEQTSLKMPVLRTTLNVLCFGVMDRNKGVIDILRAAALLPQGCDVVFQLVGPEREPGILEEVRSLIRSGGLSSRVSVLGPAFGDAKQQLFNNAAVFLLPSYVENFPLAVLEAAAAGLPIITTPVGATCEFFDHDISAIIVEPGSPIQISTAISQLLASPEKRAQLGRNARSVFVDRLRRERIMHSMAAVYDDVLGKLTVSSSPESAQIQQTLKS